MSPVKTDVGMARVYDAVADGERRVCVDRLWPRGVRKGDPRVGEWLPKVAPSNELRRWYGHVLEREAEFADRYRDELTAGEEAAALWRLAGLAAGGPVVLVTSTRELARSHVPVLVGLLDPGASADVATLRRWVDAGGTWRLVAGGAGSASRPSLTLALHTCDGGERVDTLESADPALLVHLGGRTSG